MVDPARAHSTGPVGGSDLAGRNLARVSHSSDDLHKVAAPGSFLDQTRLDGADLREANLAHADLTGANQRGTGLTKTNPMAARSMRGTRLDGVIGLSANDWTVSEVLTGHRRPSSIRSSRSPP